MNLDSCSCACRKPLPGVWSTLASLPAPREAFAGAAGPDQNATGTVRGLNDNPRLYVCGGVDKEGVRQQTCYKYNPDLNVWTSVAPLPVMLSNAGATFAPDYGETQAASLGFIYVAGGLTNAPGETPVNTVYAYDIKEDLWSVMTPLPEPIVDGALQYLDDFGGPLAELLIALGFSLPACSDTQTVWLVGGQGTEKRSYYIQSNIRGELIGDWIRGPDLPLHRASPAVGRVFWRDESITSFNVSNCASIVVAGGRNEEDEPTRDVQLLVRQNDHWRWVSRTNNTTGVPDDAFCLREPLANGAAGTEQWPETLVTGGRLMLFGGDPPVRTEEGSVQFLALRFNPELGRYQRSNRAGLAAFACLPQCDPRFSFGRHCVHECNDDSLWQNATPMPEQRTGFVALPISQQNTAFGRTSRFVCIGGRTTAKDEVTDRVQLFQLPVSLPFDDRYSCTT